MILWISWDVRAYPSHINPNRLIRYIRLSSGKIVEALTKSKRQSDGYGLITSAPASETCKVAFGLAAHFELDYSKLHRPNAATRSFSPGNVFSVIPCVYPREWAITLIPCSNYTS